MYYNPLYLKSNLELLESVDNSSSEALRPATCSRDPKILRNAKAYRTKIDRAGLAQDRNDEISNSRQ